MIYNEENAEQIQNKLKALLCMLEMLLDPFGSNSMDKVKELFRVLIDCGLGQAGGYLDINNQKALKIVLSDPQLIQLCCATLWFSKGDYRTKNIYNTVRKMVYEDFLTLDMVNFSIDKLTDMLEMKPYQKETHPLYDNEVAELDY